MRFLKKKSPEVDMLEAWSGLSRNRLQLMLLAGVLLQCHMLLLTFLSVQGRQVHPLLAGAKFAEAVGKNELGESGPRLDRNILGMGKWWYNEIVFSFRFEKLRHGQTLLFPVLRGGRVACLSVGANEFPPLCPYTSGVLRETRSVCQQHVQPSVFCGSFMLQLGSGSGNPRQDNFDDSWTARQTSVELSHGTLGLCEVHGGGESNSSNQHPSCFYSHPAHLTWGPGDICSTSTGFLRVLLPEAEAVDLMAAIIGHPGQILEPTSVLPLRNSLCLHGGLVLAALMAQVWVQRGSQTVFEAAKARDSRGACMPFFHPLPPFQVVPCWVMVLWLGASFLGIMGLILLERQKVEHPMFQRLHKKRGEDGSLAHGSRCPFF